MHLQTKHGLSNLRKISTHTRTHIHTHTHTHTHTHPHTHTDTHRHEHYSKHISICLIDKYKYFCFTEFAFDICNVELLSNKKLFLPF